MCLEVLDQYKCLHKGSSKGFEFCIWYMRVVGMPGYEESNMTCDENKLRCASASTQRYDYHEEVCTVCKEPDGDREEVTGKNMEQHKEYDAKERAELMRRDYDDRMNIAITQSLLEGRYTDPEQRLKRSMNRPGEGLKEDTEGQYMTRELRDSLWGEAQRRESRLEEKRKGKMREQQGNLERT